MKIGQPVIHMSGGYLMLIDKIHGHNVRCIWFDKDMFRCQKTFPLNSLIPIRSLPSIVNPVFARIRFN